MSARGCYVITKGVQQALPDQLRHHLRPRAPVRARNDPDPPGRVPTCPGTLQTPRRVIPTESLFDRACGVPHTPLNNGSTVSFENISDSDSEVPFVGL